MDIQHLAKDLHNFFRSQARLSTPKPASARSVY